MTTNNSSIAPEVLASLHQRRSNGENLKALAAEVGMTWQKLWVLLVATAPKTELPAVVAPAVNITERTHRQFPEVLALVQEGATNILMVGPAGTGKTTLVKHVAQAIDRQFAFLSLSAGVTETHIFGRMLPQADGTWAYVPSRFVEVYENGGVFLLDEIDAADSNVMVAINAALANGILANPVSGRHHVRHKDTVIIAAANTFGRGGDTMYVGRNALDAATLDRFVLDTLFVNYDPQLEAAIIKNAGLADDKAREVLAWVAYLRQQISAYKLRRVASTRLVERAARSISRGRSLDDVKRRYFQDWSKDELNKVGGVA